MMVDQARHPAGKQKVISYLREKIENRELMPGDKVQSTQVLADKLEVSLQTAHFALSIMSKEGWLLRKPRSGTYVAENPGRIAQRNVALIFHRDSELWKRHLPEIIAGLQERKAMAIPMNLPDERDERLMREHFERLGQYNPELVVTEYARTWAILPPKLQERPVIRFSQADPAIRKFRGDTIMPDFEEVGYQATEHLVAKGHTNIASFSIADQQANKENVKGAMFLMLQGYRQALEDHGLKPGKQFTLPPLSAADPDLLKPLLQDRERPSAVFVTQDHRSVQLLKAAESCGLRVPEDLAIASVYNTPWADSHDLTSVDVQPELILQQLMKLLDDHFDGRYIKGSNLTIKTKPKLVVRGSSGR